jgi:hypothetical protein
MGLEGILFHLLGIFKGIGGTFVRFWAARQELFLENKPPKNGCFFQSIAGFGIVLMVSSPCIPSLWRVGGKCRKMQLPTRKGESVFNNILVNCFLSLLALLVAYFCLRRAQKNKRIWYIIATVAAILSGFAFWLSRPNGLILLIGAGLLIGLGELFRNNVAA